MENFVESMLKEFEGGKISRRQLIQTISIAATACIAGEGLLAEEAPAPATLGYHTIGVNHISYSVTGKDYSVARDFYIKLFGMDYVPDQDTGAQAYMPFGPKDNGTFMLPRGGRDPNAAPPAPPAAAGAGAGAGAGRGAGGGRGGAAGAAGAPATPPQPTTLTVDQFGLTVANFDAKKVEEALKKAGLDPKKDGESFHVVDPFGMDLQVCSEKMSAY